MPDLTSLSVNGRKKSHQITCRTNAECFLTAVFSVENNSHIKAYGHSTQVDVLLDCFILTVRDIAGHQQVSLGTHHTHRHT